GDGRLAPTLAQLWPDPLLIWATPEKPDGDMISSCSLVGAHAWASTLRQMGHSFEVIYGDPDAPETRQKLDEVVRLAATALARPKKETGAEALPMASRMYLAMRSFLDTEGLDAMTIRCWPELPNTFGQWPYLGIARLTDEGRAVACEGDADGAMSAWIGESLGMGRCYLTDWLEHDQETITLW